MRILSYLNFSRRLSQKRLNSKKMRIINRYFCLQKVKCSSQINVKICNIWKWFQTSLKNKKNNSLFSVTINSKKRRKKKGEKRIQRVHSSVTSMKANCGQRLESRASHYRGISTLLRSHRWHRNEANSVRLLKHCANMFFQQSRNDDLD